MKEIHHELNDWTGFDSDFEKQAGKWKTVFNLFLTIVNYDEKIRRIQKALTKHLN
jgi:hypothetical protein